MTERLGRFVDSAPFQHGVLAVIVMAAVLVGLETSRDLVARHGALLHGLDKVVLGIFILEAALKIGRHGRRWYRYFTDPWNVFDFLIVVVCLLPVGGQYAAVLRLARVLRALRLVTAVPRLQLLVSSLLKSIPSLGYVGLLLTVLFYVYAVMGIFLFRGNDPVHFQDLSTSLLTLFRVVTLEDWTDVMYIQMYGSDAYPGYADFAQAHLREASLGPAPPRGRLLRLLRDARDHDHAEPVHRRDHQLHVRGQGREGGRGTETAPRARRRDQRRRRDPSHRGGGGEAGTHRLGELRRRAGKV